MENVTDALQMAFAVGIFVLALSLTITNFSNVRSTSDSIISYIDSETEYIAGDMYYKATENKARNVGKETIIPTVFRAYKENYLIIFKTNGKSDDCLWITSGRTTASENNLKSMIIDLRDTAKTEATQHNPKPDNVQDDNEQYLMELLCYGASSNSTYTRENIKNKYFKIDIKQTISEWIGDNPKITENIGVFYLEDVDHYSDVDGTPVLKTTIDDSVPNSNKTEKRIITYTKY